MTDDQIHALIEAAEAGDTDAASALLKLSEETLAVFAYGEG